LGLQVLLYDHFILIWQGVVSPVGGGFDPDTRKMPTAQGTVIGCNAQVAVDAKPKLIAAAAVTHEVTDLQPLADVALEAKTNLEVQQAEVLADARCYNASEVSRCLDAGLTPYIPKADASANTARGLYGKGHFHYDAQKDVYLCPAGTGINLSVCHP
jgi:hypothetical protein